MAGFSDAVLIVATLLGPVFAVQAQKFLERRRDASARRDKIFRTLMATRASRLSGAHVEALNLIDLEFYEPKRRFLKQNRDLTRVRSAWQSYLQHLFEPYPKDRAIEAVYLQARQNLFTDLLYEMATALGYDEFDKNELRKLSYSPVAHEDVERDSGVIRRGLAQVFSGQASIPMRVVKFPFVPTGTQAPDAVEPLQPVETPAVEALASASPQEQDSSDGTHLGS